MSRLPVPNEGLHHEILSTQSPVVLMNRCVLASCTWRKSRPSPRGAQVSDSSSCTFIEDLTSLLMSLMLPPIMKNSTLIVSFSLPKSPRRKRSYSGTWQAVLGSGLGRLREQGRPVGRGAHSLTGVAPVVRMKCPGVQQSEAAYQPPESQPPCAGPSMMRGRRARFTMYSRRRPKHSRRDQVAESRQDASKPSPRQVSKAPSNP